MVERWCNLCLIIHEATSRDDYQKHEKSYGNASPDREMSPPFWYSAITKRVVARCASKRKMASSRLEWACGTSLLATYRSRKVALRIGAERRKMSITVCPIGGTGNVTSGVNPRRRARRNELVYLFWHVGPSGPISCLLRIGLWQRRIGQSHFFLRTWTWHYRNTWQVLRSL